jgi:hypothetical protein
MDPGEILYISSRLLLGALASFFAIMVWSKTRDAAWMLLVIGTITAYADIVYSILGMFGVTDGSAFLVGSIPLARLILSNLSSGFFIAAFLVMIVRNYHH